MGDPCGVPPSNRNGGIFVLPPDSTATKGGRMYISAGALLALIILIVLLVWIF